MQPDMKRLVTSRLKHLVNVGTIVKVRNKYNTLIQSSSYIIICSHDSANKCLSD